MTQYGGMGGGKTCGKTGIRGKMWRNAEKDDGLSEKCCDAGRGKYPTMLIFYKELHSDVPYHPIYSRYVAMA